MNTMMMDVVSQPRRLVEIWRRWMHDNNELHQSRFVSEKSKVKDDLKRVTANLVKERVIWARDVAEKDRILSHAKVVQEELERKAVSEAQKVRSELTAEVEMFHINTNFVYQVKERYQSLTLELEASNAKAQAKQVELEEREEQLRKLQQERLKEAESALDQSNTELDILTSRLAGLQGDKNWLISNDLVGAFEYLR
ncbi:hypothetical protein Hanom_Chr01g00037531 [Helianthus anomalus]